MTEDLHNFYLNEEEPLQSYYLALRDLILDFDKSITQTIKYKMPCFLFKKKIICYFWKDKITQEPYILWAKGNELPFPELETGNRSKMKILRLNVMQNIPHKRIQLILQAAIDL